MTGRLLRVAQVIERARQQVVGDRQLVVHGDGARCVVPRQLEAPQVVQRGGPQEEELRGIRRTLRPVQRGKRLGGLALFEQQRGVHDLQIRVARSPAQQPVENAARLLDLALVEQVVHTFDLGPFGLGQRLVGIHWGDQTSGDRPARHPGPAPGLPAPQRLVLTPVPDDL